MLTAEELVEIVKRAAEPTPAAGTEQAEPSCVAILKCMLHGLVLHQAIRLVSKVQQQIAHTKDELLELRRELTHLAEQFSSEPGKTARPPQPDWWQNTSPDLVQELNRRLPEMLLHDSACCRIGVVWPRGQAPPCAEARLGLPAEAAQRSADGSAACGPARAKGSLAIGRSGT